MEILVFVILNLVLVVLLAVAVKLLRSPAERREDVDPTRKRRLRGRRERVETTAVAPATAEAPRDQKPTTAVEEVVEETDVVGAPTGHIGERARAVAAPPDEIDLRVEPIGARFKTSEELFAVDRPGALERDPSRIRLVSTLNGSGPNRATLVGGVIRTLGSLGLEPAEVDGRRSRLATSDGRRAAVNVDAMHGGADVIDVIVDASLAPDALRALTRWHRTDLDDSDRVQIRAWDR